MIATHTMRDVQQALAGRGFNPGSIDGLWGPRTSGVVADFERQAGMQVDGKLDAKIMARLFGAAASAPGTTGEIRQGRKGYVVREIVLHTTATDADWCVDKTAQQMMAEVREWHMARGWRAEGYHGLIAPDGSRAIGRAYDEIGAHVKEANRGTIGLTMVPIKWIDRMGVFEHWYTEAQRAAAQEWIAEIAALTPLQQVTGHNQYANKLCPGFIVDSTEWMPR